MSEMRTVTNTNTGRQIRILLINPNATKSMTEACIDMVASTLPPDVSVTGFTAPEPAPSAIEGNFDGVMSAAASMRAVMPIAADYDAFLVACYSDHALIRMLREEFRQPTIGIMEASLIAARTLGGRLGLVATGARSKVMGEDSIHYYGMEPFTAGVEHCGLGVLELEHKPEKEINGIMVATAKRLVERGADVLTLGCAGMTKLKPAIEETVGSDVQVIDGVLAGVHHLIGIVRIGGSTAKAGLYKSSAEGRKARGQTYY
ncbi:asp/Glu/hydantoin racemase-like protein [Elsinoe australis]|uniref:Asp/Glu/hydantoin racemase-like protein n=1 Tax=Elsinoe australis TaxID=40998 RepID=A0A4U7AXQ7_9PEZI|nr:asp/Glu/hydantoin racemase-like protein [Elsinoe australis]